MNLEVSDVRLDVRDAGEQDGHGHDTCAIPWGHRPRSSKPGSTLGLQKWATQRLTIADTDFRGRQQSENEDRKPGRQIAMGASPCHESKRRREDRAQQRYRRRVARHSRRAGPACQPLIQRNAVRQLSFELAAPVRYEVVARLELRRVRLCRRGGALRRTLRGIQGTTSDIYFGVRRAARQIFDRVAVQVTAGEIE